MTAVIIVWNFVWSFAYCYFILRIVSGFTSEWCVYCFKHVALICIDNYNNLMWCVKFFCREDVKWQLWGEMNFNSEYYFGGIELIFRSTSSW